MKHLTLVVSLKIDVIFLLVITQEFNKLFSILLTFIFEFLLHLLDFPYTGFSDTFYIKIRAIRRDFLKIHIFRFVLCCKILFFVTIRVIMLPSQYQFVDGTVLDNYSLWHNVRVLLLLLIFLLWRFL